MAVAAAVGRVSGREGVLAARPGRREAQEWKYGDQGCGQGVIWKMGNMRDYRIPE